MNNFGKVVTTGTIWLAVMMVLIFSEPSGGNEVWMTLILGLTAAASTRFIWEARDHQPAAYESDAAKAKRSDRVSRLVDKLSEDEVYELEELLTARRDEPYTGR